MKRNYSVLFCKKCRQPHRPAFTVNVCAGCRKEEKDVIESWYKIKSKSVPHLADTVKHLNDHQKLPKFGRAMAIELAFKLGAFVNEKSL